MFLTVMARGAIFWAATSEIQYFYKTDSFSVLSSPA